jgi:putative heme iron utilization protein
MTEANDSADRFRTPNESIVVEAGEFLSAFRSLQMATVSANGIPDASYAPFVRIDDNAFYVNLSALSTHTGNLLATPRVSILFLQAEEASKQLFARKRLSFDADTDPVRRDSARWCQVMDLFADKFGDIMDLIRPLQDFKLFRIQPRSGVYVRGFAQAYPLEDSKLAQLRRINDL